MRHGRDGSKQRDAVELQCLTVSCGSDTGKRARKKRKQEKPKNYFLYSFKDKVYTQLCESFISYRAVNMLSVIKINLLVL